MTGWWRFHKRRREQLADEQDSGYISSVLAMSEFKIDYGHPVPAGIDDVGYAYDTWQKSLIVSILSAGT